MPGPAAGHGPGVDPELAARMAQALEAGLNPATTGGAEAALRALEAAPGFPSALLALALAEPVGPAALFLGFTPPRLPPSRGGDLRRPPPRGRPGPRTAARSAITPQGLTRA